MMSNLCALVCLLTTCASWQPATLPGVAAIRSRKLSMVTWDRVPADTMWARAAWQELGLSSSNMPTECVMIPNGMAPDTSRQVRPCEPGALVARHGTPVTPTPVCALVAQWYFCSQPAADDSSVTCLALPTYQPDASVYICSTPLGARPGYTE